MFFHYMMIGTLPRIVNKLVNVHGHTHSNVAMKDILIHQEDDTFVESVPDERYICVCMEHLDNYRPIHMDEIVARIKSLGLDKGGEY